MGVALPYGASLTCCVALATVGGDDLLSGVADLRVGDGGWGRHGGVLPAMMRQPVIAYDASEPSYEVYDYYEAS
jgi:hypothetical protein